MAQAACIPPKRPQKRPAVSGCFWEESALNRENGGPLSEPHELWKSAAARAELLSRADYIIARYSAFSSVFGFQVPDEGDNSRLLLTYLRTYVLTYLTYLLTYLPT